MYIHTWCEGWKVSWEQPFNRTGQKQLENIIDSQGSQFLRGKDWNAVQSPDATVTVNSLREKC